SDVRLLRRRGERQCVGRSVAGGEPSRDLRRHDRGDQRGGGYSITLPEADTSEDVRAYLVQTAEKGMAWGRLRAHGRAGHGSVPNDENAIVRLARAIAAIDAHDFPIEY